MGGLSRYLVQEGVLAEKITDDQVLFILVDEVVCNNLLPQAIRDIPW